MSDVQGQEQLLCEVVQVALRILREFDIDFNPLK